MALLFDISASFFGLTRTLCSLQDCWVEICFIFPDLMLLHITLFDISANFLYSDTKMSSSRKVKAEEIVDVSCNC